MRIDGREIAKEIFEDLKKRVGELKEKGVIPHLAIILVGNDPASKAYVRQKELKAAEIGAKTTLIHKPTAVLKSELLSTIEQFNNDNNIHGIIVQRPLPPQIDINDIDMAVDPQKDVDGFHKDSPFLPPLGEAVYKILQRIPEFETKKIAILGKGKTGGAPVIQVLNNHHIPFLLVDSKTPNPQTITKNADVIISAIGKPKMIKKEMIKKGAMLIGVGMHRDNDGRLHGDYNEKDIKDIASFYTPIPGGVGPVNVAMLLENLVQAAER